MLTITMFQSGTILSLLLFLLIVGVVLVILVDTGDSGRKFAWLLIIALIPIVGLILYLLFGINRRHQYHFDRTYRCYEALFAEKEKQVLDDALFGNELSQEVKEEFRPLVTLLSSNQRPSVSIAHEVEIITEGERKLELLLQDLQQARKSIYMEYYHFGIDNSSRHIRDILMQKAREGLDVRFINENVANLPILPAYYNAMKRAGVKVVHFTNLRYHLFDMLTRINYRDHRKIVIIDGEIGYVGGMNINNHYFYQWRDTHLRITGTAVASLEYLFMDSWLTADGKTDSTLFSNLSKTTSPQSEGTLIQIVPDGPDSRWPILEMSYEWTLVHAKHYMYMQTPYFAPPEPLLSAMKAAALAGVDIRLMVPQRPDSWLLRPVNKSYYKEILEAGVRVFERKGNFMHCKTFVCDDYLSSIGSANLDYRSLCLDYEANSYIYDTDFALRNKAIFFDDLEQCEEVTLANIAQRRWYERLWQGFIRLFSPLL